MREELIEAVEGITAQMQQEIENYKAATDRDDIFEIKKQILTKIRLLEKKLLEINGKSINETV